MRATDVRLLLFPLQLFAGGSAKLRFSSIFRATICRRFYYNATSAYLPCNYLRAKLLMCGFILSYLQIFASWGWPVLGFTLQPHEVASIGGAFGYYCLGYLRSLTSRVPMLILTLLPARSRAVRVFGYSSCVCAPHPLAVVGEQICGEAPLANTLPAMTSVVVF